MAGAARAEGRAGDGPRRPRSTAGRRHSSAPARPRHGRGAGAASRTEAAGAGRRRGRGRRGRLRCFSAPLGSGLGAQAPVACTLHPFLLLPLPPAGSRVAALPPRPRKPAARSEDTGGSADRGGCGIQYGGRGRAAHLESAVPASAPPGDRVARGPRSRRTIETRGAGQSGRNRRGGRGTAAPGSGSERCGADGRH